MAAGSSSTQLDPIGLGGGLNLYGFANGDPVNFSDPFGLCAAADTVRVTVQCPNGTTDTTQFATATPATAAENGALVQALASMGYGGMGGVIDMVGLAALAALRQEAANGFAKFNAVSTQGYPVITAAQWGQGWLYLRDDVAALATGGGMNSMVPVPTGGSTMSVCSAIGHEGFHMIGMPPSAHPAIAILQTGFKC